MPVTKKSPAGKTGRPPKVPGEKPTRDKIFDAAVDLFSEKGYDRTTVRDIARAAGITESAVYRHYTGKESILDAIFEYMEARVYSPLPPLPDSGNAESSIFRDLLEGLPRYIISEPVLVKIIRILFMEMPHNGNIRDYMKREYVERADDYTEALFQKQIDDNKIRSCDPRVLAEVFNSFRFTWLFRNFIIDYGKTPDVRAMEEELWPHIEFFEKLFVP
ncbi:TetR/AcrR family transcriptional regulator [Methanolacinia paynteri]|uniref:TetR/AcrR family transcriptional regulator n=1 Tax=Methanolacinia paynteri TaxID=230356 RepID=UPI00064FE7A1|nr:TetR/AcrR family transcriptional regulator [Methanolacinia paynteri]